MEIGFKFLTIETVTCQNCYFHACVAGSGTNYANNHYVIRYPEYIGQHIDLERY